jgi:hypothetical protein
MRYRMTLSRLARVSCTLMLVASAGCDLCQKPVGNSTAATTTGELEVLLHERGSCGVSLCTLAGWGRVVVYPAGGADAAHDAYFFDALRVALPAGRYDVIVAPDGAPLDHAATGVLLGDGAGLRIERSYWSDADATVVALLFAAGTESSKARLSGSRRDSCHQSPGGLPRSAGAPGLA